MNTRLAQIIAQSASIDGKLDRARLLDALSTTPDDPVYLVVEAVLAVEHGLARLRNQEATQANALSGVFAENAKQFSSVLSEHAARMEAVKEQLAILAEELAVARADSRAKLDHDAQALRAAGEILHTHATAIRAEVERHARRVPLVAFGGLEFYGPDNALVRSLIILLVGFFAGVSIPLIYFLLR